MHFSAALALALSPAVLSASASAPASQRPPSPAKFAPSPEHARENAPHVFNAVHSAMRQWGSSIHHNGLGVIPATVPRGTLLYHGARRNETPAAFEWLAFEMEHSEGFARSWRGGDGFRPPRPPGPPGKGHRPPGWGDDKDGQRVLTGDDDDDGHHAPTGEPASRGYFHTYRANRDLKLLYIDGMGAGKTNMGTLDTQDFLLRGVLSAPALGEYERARDVCALVKSWGLDGVIRMEIGFEAIYCDFSDGLDQVSVLRRPWSDQAEGVGSIDMFEWARAVGQRYDGIGGGRVRLGFGSMVSSAWYPVNVSNPNGRKEMPRLGKLEEGQRDVILKRVEEVVKGGVVGSVDWQGVVDMIVSRHADRIEALADEGEDGGDYAFVSQVLVVTNTFVDYLRDESDADVTMKGDIVADAKGRCVRQYLTPAAVWKDEWTAEDALIFEAVKTVVERICGDLYAVRGIVLEAEPKLASAFSEAEMTRVVGASAREREIGDAVRRGREVVRGLKGYLGWSVWKKCKPGCGVAEVCFVAMWPFGLKRDHYSPSCQNRTALMGRRTVDGEGYWDFEPGPFGV
ncbi:hypothetical protein CkaCkLH20_04229 [Colletotrichum karsti]|uniref:Uncharacterized protein n=1 Tax=Colletotrichum karsti TaxID=1095194 RepID=A0A9P6LMG6_9PEZI|nr:uncharacterized protein CkaCkLH20_04229 [Colletotrichum karsti]KAF9878191.1 hypothetical protein CkaCkLH20_04229 [Colletotrichum karsti]